MNIKNILIISLSDGCSSKMTRGCRKFLPQMFVFYSGYRA